MVSPNFEYQLLSQAMPLFFIKTNPHLNSDLISVRNCLFFFFCFTRNCPTAGVISKGGIWRRKHLDAESASWCCFSKGAAKASHLLGNAVMGSFHLTYSNLIIALLSCKISLIWLSTAHFVSSRIPFCSAVFRAFPFILLTASSLSWGVI